MEEKNVNKIEFDECCCGPEEPKPPKKHHNHCQEGCCEAKEVNPNYMDIRHAKCIPILAERIYDCVNIESGGMKYVNLEFEITSDTKHYRAGDEICIKKIAVTYDFIGLKTPLPVIVDNAAMVNFAGDPCSATYTCDGNILYSTFLKAVETNLEEWCHDKGRKSKIAVPDAKFYVCNLNIYVYGKIGCHDFEGKLKDPYSGPLEDLGIGSYTGLKSLDFLGTMCFPAGHSCLSMELKFNGKLGIDCIRANDKYNPMPWGQPKGDQDSDRDNDKGSEKWFRPKFEASALVSLCEKLQVYSTIKEELVVYTTPRGFICDDCDHDEK